MRFLALFLCWLALGAFSPAAPSFTAVPDKEPLVFIWNRLGLYYRGFQITKRRFRWSEEFLWQYMMGNGKKQYIPARFAYSTEEVMNGVLALRPSLEAKIEENIADGSWKEGYPYQVKLHGGMAAPSKLTDFGSSIGRATVWSIVKIHVGRWEDSYLTVKVISWTAWITDEYKFDFLDDVPTLKQGELYLLETAGYTTPFQIESRKWNSRHPALIKSVELWSPIPHPQDTGDR